MSGFFFLCCFRRSSSLSTVGVASPGFMVARQLSLRAYVEQ
jgi:hypothetical protein